MDTRQFRPMGSVIVSLFIGLVIFGMAQATTPTIIETDTQETDLALTESALKLGMAYPPAKDRRQRAFAAKHLKNLHVNLVRLSTTWKRDEPRQGKFNWKLLNGHLRWAHENHFSLLLTISAKGPVWACDPNKIGIRGGCVPSDMRDFENYVQALVSHLHMVQSLINTLPISKIQFGNEWDNPDVGFYPGTAQEYTEQLNIVYEEVKGVFPNIPVLPGGLLSHNMRSIAICNGSKHFGDPPPGGLARFCHNPKHLEKIKRLEYVFGFGKYDMVDQHLYFDPENWKVYLDTLRNYVLPPWNNRLPIIVSEFGGPNAKHAPRHDHYHARQVDAYIQALLTTDVTEAYYFKLVEPAERNETGGQSSYAESGLIDKTPSLKPAYDVYRDYAKHLNSPGT